MARPWQAPRLLLTILVALVAVTYQGRRKTLMSIQEVSAVEEPVAGTLRYVIKEYNKQSEDKYSFRILRVLKILKKVTDHLEFHMNLEMQRTTCLRADDSNCDFQTGELYKQIQCLFVVIVDPWLEKYKIVNKNCSSV
ncbi:cystatin-11 [Oryctolagus cuniculus]|uniref:cystatin-11 n=1 Tax=Oryctolagus cuniculus TaxID=9986 RepID=UPI00223199C3|nr:cystatin-11 [Oryctolagus cuniculus]